MATATYEAVQSADRPVWQKPHQEAPKRLMVMNSLTERLEEFVPHEGNRVRWYTCGPTVYDVCHMGHARAYLTFDILRRIMTDYLHFDVEYHVNITDVDDKIILRARRNFLVEDYLKSAPTKEDMLSRARAALEVERAKIESKKCFDENELGSTKLSGKRKAELEEQLKVSTLKLEKVLKDQIALSESSVSTLSVEELVAKCSEPLGISLDAECGAKVSDNKIFEKHARRFEESFMIDMQRLGVRPPDVLTRVTEYVPKIIEYCEKLVDSGFAYAANGSVYLDTKAFENHNHTYRKLKPFSGETSKEEMEEGEGALGCGKDSEKRDPARDFALWKKSKEGTGEPGWESPWGRGRPGWHIECSVVASDVLGSKLDIHAGGEDLKFPHHDNELAQSEAYHKCDQWVNYFFHAGHLHIKGLKMSKSLKNFVTIEEALQISTPRRLRILFLIQPWDGAFTYSDQSLEEAKSKEKRFAEFLGNCKSLDRDLIRVWLRQDINEPSPAEKKFAELLNQKKREAHEAILSNFNTPACVDALGSIIDGFYAYKDEAKDRLSYPICIEAGRFVSRIMSIFGVDFEYESGQSESKDDVVAPFVETIVGFREQVKQFAQETTSVETKVAILKLCDKLRDDTLVDLGVSLQDDGGKALWKLRDPKELRQEQMEAKAKIQQEAEAKRARAVKKLEEDIESFSQILLVRDGANLFRSVEYSEWDEQGLPTKDAAGELLSKSALKKNAKEKESAAGKWERLSAAAKKEGCNSVETFIEQKKLDLEALKSGAIVGKKKVAESSEDGRTRSNYFVVAGTRFPTAIASLVGKEFPSCEEYFKYSQTL